MGVRHGLPAGEQMDIVWRFLRIGSAGGLLLAGSLILWSCRPAPAQDNAAPKARATKIDKTGRAKPAKSTAPKETPGVRAVGRLFRVVLPITDQTITRLEQAVSRVVEKARAEGVRPVLIFEFTVLKGQSEYGRGTTIGNAYDLARFLYDQPYSTKAYVPQTIQGHSVLAVLACNEIIMAPEAEIGPAGVDEPAITKEILRFYEGIPGLRKRTAVASKLVDPAQELLEVETDVGTEWVTRQGLESLVKTLPGRTITKETVLSKGGEPGRFSAALARRVGLISYLAADRNALARALQLGPEGLQEEIQVAGPFRAVRVDLKGPITGDVVERARRMIRETVQANEVIFICLRIDSAGGSLDDSRTLANFLALDLDSSQVRTVAYVPEKARADAALIALACDEIAMHPGAVLGGEGDYSFSAPEIDEVSALLREKILRKKTRSWSLPLAMFNPSLAVRRYTRGAETAFFCTDEWKERPDRDQWREGEEVTARGRPFLVKGSDAGTYPLGLRKVEDFAEFRQLYNIEDDPALLEPSWVDRLVDILATQELAVILLILGGAALYAELQSPGIGLGAFVALVCFALFFWSRFLGGTVGVLELVLFVAGITCLLLEVFVIPGFGVFGLGGGVLILTSLVLASQTFFIPRNEYQAGEFQNSLLALAAAIVGIIVVAATINRWLPHAPLLGRMVLQPPSEEEAGVISESESLTHFEGLLGRQGRTTTPLMPSGKARFGSELLDVMTDGEFVPRDTPIEVIEVQGNRVVVRAVDQTT